MTMMSRRDVLKVAGAGVAGVITAAAGEQQSSAAGAGKIPISLIIDDGGPVDAMFYMHPGYETPWIDPNVFTLLRWPQHRAVSVPHFRDPVSRLVRRRLSDVTVASGRMKEVGQIAN